MTGYDTNGVSHLTDNSSDSAFLIVFSSMRDSMHFLSQDSEISFIQLVYDAGALTLS
jgi:hypothetical protein